MALYARELSKCARAALSRQFQVCARQREACLNMRVPSMVPIRCVNGSSHNGSVGHSGTGIAGRTRDTRSGKALNQTGIERMRIKFVAPANASNHLRPGAENLLNGSRTCAKQPMKTKLGNVTGQSDPARAPLLGELIEKQAKLKPNRKGDMKSKKSSTGKFQKKRNETATQNDISLLEPMSKLSKDINQWFKEVMEHLAKAERQAPAFGAQTSSSASKKQQRSNQLNSKDKSRKTSQAKTTNEKDSASIHAHQNRVIGETTGKPVTKESMNIAHGRLSASKTSAISGYESFSGDGDRKLKSQLDALKGELSRYSIEDNQEGGRGLGTETSEFQSGSLGSDGRKMEMLEIKPSYVGNPGKSETFLASTSAWLPYGAIHDTLPGTPSRKGKGKHSDRSSKLGIPITSSAASAAASNVLSGSSAHQLVTPSGSATSNVPGMRKQNSWEKGKGFILLNNKDKEKEALERQAWLKKNQAAKLSSGSKNTSFILVDSENSANTPSTRSASKKNILLGDNPHTMAAKIVKGSRENDTHTTTVPTGNIRIGNNGHREGLRVEEKAILSQTSGGKAEAETGGLVDLESKRWVDLVKRKLLEIQKAKMVAAETAKSQLELGEAAAGRVEPKRSRTVKASSSSTGPGTAPGVDRKGGNIPPPGVRKRPPSTGKQDPGLGKTRGSVHDPKAGDGSDAEYERRIEQFINGSMGYEDPVDSSKTRRLFGPLTREQHELVEKIRKSGIFKDLTSTRVPTFSGKKDPAVAVAVNELKPDVKTSPRIEKSERSLDKKNEPTLYVKPEELATMKKPAPPKRLMESERTNKNVGESYKLLSSNSAINAARGDQTRDFEQSELWLSLLQNKINKYRALSEAGTKEGGKKKVKQNSALHRSSSELCSNEKPCDETGSSCKPGNCGKAKAQIERGAESVSKAESSHSFNNVDSKTTQEPVWQHEFLKTQQEKLTRSKRTNSPPKSVSQTAVEKSLPPRETSSSSKPNSFISKSDMEQTRVKGQMARSIVGGSLSPMKESPPDSSKKGHNSKATKSKRKSPIEAASSKDLDPFEAWVQSMEDWKSTGKGHSGVVNKHREEPADKRSHSKRKPKKSVLNEGTYAKKTSEPEQASEKKKKNYSRFEHTPRSEIAREMYKDLRATYAPSQQQASAANYADRSKGKSLTLNTLSQSDQIYNMIKESVQPRSGVPLTGAMSPVGRRSKVLTQSGLGPVISNSTGIVDPARLPKLGNLFNSFDGFIAMDAVPVLDAKIGESPRTDSTTARVDSSTVKTTKTSQASADGLSGTESDLRASLAKEREAASNAARRKLIEEYEKSIERYERGLEIYRSKLRRVRQAMAEQALPVKKTDNPRRQSDL